MGEVPVVVPTHERAGKLRVLAAMPADKLTLCVAESQADVYQDAHPGMAIVVHPDSVKGISPKRQWIYETFGDVFMLDDDVTHLARVYDTEGDARVDPEIAWEIVQATAEGAREVGAFLWGLANTATPTNYAPQRPFRTTGYINAMATGLFAGSRLWYPDDPHCVAEDYWVSALNAYYHRFIWADTRFGFHQVDTFHNPGGLSAYRNLHHEKRWLDELRRCFGVDAFPVRGERAGHRHQFQKTLRVPW